MKLLLAGAWEHPIYEQSTARALEGLGVEVIPFDWNHWHARFFSKLGMKLGRDTPFATGLLRELKSAIRLARPDVVLLWRPLLFGKRAVRSLRNVAPNALFVCYNNDNPFALGGVRNGLLWRPFVEAIPEYDLQLVYRNQNLADFTRAGARHVALWRAAYMDDVLEPVTLSESDRAHYACDVVFAGHYEDDGRVHCLEALARAGVKLRLFGSSDWPREIVASIAPDSWPVRRPAGREYATALCGAKIALVFLSKHNSDTYTRRNFEIPACGVCMVSVRTDDLTSLFEEDHQAVFFSTPDELVEKVRALLADDARRCRIAQAGRARVISAGHGVGARAKQLLDLIESHGGPSRAAR